jgi:acyl transferase domain-containing protein/acyl carrier protein
VTVEITRQANELQNWLLQQLSKILGLEPGQIDIRIPFEEYGVTSRDALLLSGDLETYLGRDLSPTLLWEYPTIEKLVQHFCAVPEITPITGQQGFSQVASTVPLAIISLSCRFPQANSAQDFWQLLREGRDAIRELPLARRNSYLSMPCTLWGGFLDQIESFDPHFFHISPREAIQMDPQQRLLLEVAWEALEDAGLATRYVKGSRTGVFIGMSNSDYTHLQLRQRENISAHMGTGGALSIAANRLSYFFDFRGPSMVVDTACSSSLTALHLACQSLRSGEIDMALVGGVNLLLSSEWTVVFSKVGMLAADGRCKTFDSRADGYVRREGCGVLVLKRLPDALQHHDRILAQVRGTAINQDGSSNGLTAPHGRAQQEVIQAALENAGLTPNHLDYIEAHGTGTSLGDPIEIAALSKSLQARDAQLPPCAIGSVKTNIGHLEAAAGIAGVITAVRGSLDPEGRQRTTKSKADKGSTFPRTAVRWS